MSLLDRIATLPSRHDPDRAAQCLGDLDASAKGDDALRKLLRNATARQTLAAVFGNSPYLRRTALRAPDDLPTLLLKPPETALDDILAAMATAARDEEPIESLMRHLRIAKRRAHFLIALADITSVWRESEVMQAISRFADGAVSAALARLLADAGRAGDLSIADMSAPEAGSALVVVAMGKHGAMELNYSSDIDFIVVYDPGAIEYSGRRSLRECFIRIVQNLVKVLQEMTGDGYVLRTDLRLRPDPSVTPVAITMAAAEQYYESMGQNWERAAMIKARAIAGDIAAGERFLERLQPFIWRRNLDFAAIEDVHAIKRQIHNHRGHGAVAIEGHNIKLGRGGIRDIEFFAQTQQLIAGGRDTGLRQRGTCEAMRALQGAGWIDGQAADEMIAAYHFHRRVEHRLQMINDEQTHSIGASSGHVSHLACFLGYDDDGRFRSDLLAHLTNVERHYAALFERGPERPNGARLVFDSNEDDEETAETLRAMGFERPEAIAGTVRSWRHGRYRAGKSTRSRELLGNLLQPLLDALAQTSDPDGAFNRFDSFLQSLPAGVQLFSLLQANPGLLAMLAQLMGDAPRLSTYLSRNVGVLDAVLAEDFFDPLPGAKEMAQSLDAGLRLARDFEDRLDVARRYVKERKFQVGVQTIRGSADGDAIGSGLANLAQAALATLLPHVLDDFVVRERRGCIDGGDMAIIAMGKFGSREMNESSDLDLVFVYDYEGELAKSDGARGLAPSHYYTRLSQRLLNAVTAPTGEGVLYEVDMRLRPSGNKGPVASRLVGFERYQHEEAWTWEHMALTRARVVVGPEALVERLNGIIRDCLTRPREAAKIARDVVDMRARIARERRRSDAPWNLKNVRGGLIDVEFICQFLQLTHAAEVPEILDTHCRSAFAKLATAAVLSPETTSQLIAASMLYSNLAAVLRVAVEGDFDPADAPQGLQRTLARYGEVADFPALTERLIATQQSVRALFAERIEALAES